MYGESKNIYFIFVKSKKAETNVPQPAKTYGNTYRFFGSIKQPLKADIYQDSCSQCWALTKYPTIPKFGNQRSLSVQ